jgi:hypothetical protein
MTGKFRITKLIFQSISKWKTLLDTKDRKCLGSVHKSVEVEKNLGIYLG